MGYLVTHVAFLLASPSLWNMVALVVADGALLASAVCEEQTLALDPQYRCLPVQGPLASCSGVVLTLVNF